MNIKNKINLEKAYDYVLQFRDVRAAGLVLFLVIVLLISWSGIKVIDTNYGLQKQISTLDQQVQVSSLANKNMQLENNYFQTNEYLDIAAREQYGLAAPGETVLNVPQNVAMAHTVTLPDTDQVEAKKTQAKQPAYQRHFQQWMNFFLHRQTPS